MRNTILLGVGMLVSISSIAQITPLGTAPRVLSNLLNLEVAGPKYIWISNTGFTIYNLDLSPYASISYPALPSGYQYTGGPHYLTEALFDTDNSTLEFMVTTYDSLGWLGTRVMRMDGTVLLEEPNHFPGGAYEVVNLSISGCIMSTPDGPRMVLSRWNPEGSIVYSLPGAFPCLPSCGTLVNGLSDDHAAIQPKLIIQPNPAADEVTVQFPLADMQGVSNVVITGTDGRVIGVYDMRGDRTLHIDTSTFSNGQYQCTLISNTKTLASAALIIAR
jgi:hypothetical protein